MTATKTISKKHTIKEILKHYFDDYLSDPDRELYLEDHHFKAIHAILNCRSARLGLFEFKCACCDQTLVLSRSCKNRFCSTCGAGETYRWADMMLSRLIDNKHHHVVFTLPSPMRHLAQNNDTIIYNLLFRTSQKVIQDWFDYKHGLKAGMVSVLHTAGSDLKYHPHVHMIVTGGGLNVEGDYQELEKDYLCRQRFIAKRFKKGFIKGLEKLHVKGQIKTGLRQQDPIVFNKWLQQIKDKHWIVSIQKSLPNVEKLIAYVGRYTKRACISEYRLQSIQNGRIKFNYKDYKNSVRGEKPLENSIEISSTAFLDRLLKHVPPRSFRMVRYYGIYATGKINQLPEQLKRNHKNHPHDISIDEEEIELLESEIFSLYRKAVIRKKGYDPLWCQECNLLLKPWRIKYVNKGAINYQYIDSG